MGLSDAALAVGMAVEVVVGTSVASPAVGAELAVGRAVGVSVALPGVGPAEGLAVVWERSSTHSSASVSHWQRSTLRHFFLFDCSAH